MDKLSYMRTASQNLRSWLRPSRHYLQPRFEDKYIKEGVQFKHSWGQLAHMHDLRVWTLAYSKGRRNHFRRM